jgi:two-component system chemotaxis response regulator CheY
MLVKKTLQPSGLDVVEATNGEEALSLCQSTKVSLFIVDVNMPVMDGFGFVRRLKERSDYKNTPVVFLTTESSASKKEMGRELGVNGWIVKPFEQESLKKVVGVLLGS